MKQVVYGLGVVIAIASQIMLAYQPAFAAAQCETQDKSQWQPAQLPSEIKNKYGGDTKHPITVFKGVINTHGDVAYLVREDFNGGQHAAPAQIVLKMARRWKSIFDDFDVNLTDNPLVILSKSKDGFFELCNPFPCCGNPPIQYRFNGSGYELLK